MKSELKRILRRGALIVTLKHRRLRRSSYLTPGMAHHDKLVL